jgi:hypothetical protein
MIEDGEMPPSYYVALHSEALLTPAELERFIKGLQRTFGEPSEEEHSDGHGGHEH